MRSSIMGHMYLDFATISGCCGFRMWCQRIFCLLQPDLVYCICLCGVQHWGAICVCNCFSGQAIFNSEVQGFFLDFSLWCEQCQSSLVLLSIKIIACGHTALLFISASEGNMFYCSTLKWIVLRTSGICNGVGGGYVIKINRVTVSICLVRTRVKLHD